MILETERLLAEDLERLEQAIADRLLEEPRAVSIPPSSRPQPFPHPSLLHHPLRPSSLRLLNAPVLTPLLFPYPALTRTQIRERLSRDHQISRFIDRHQDQSRRLLHLQTDPHGTRTTEIATLSRGDPFEEFYRHLTLTKDFHRRYPNEPVENLERSYKRRAVEVPGSIGVDGLDVESMFTGEEFNGRFLDITALHTEYLNLPGVKRTSYLQYLSMVDKFEGFTKSQKANDQYFGYLGNVGAYLESFLRRTRPLENPDGILKTFDEEFEKAWDAGQISVFPPPKGGAAGPQKQATEEEEGESYCSVCAKQFGNKKAYTNHLPGRKHRKALTLQSESDGRPAGDRNPTISASKLKERALAHREHRITSLTTLLTKPLEDTKINVERKQSLTERERQMELDALLKESHLDPSIPPDHDSDADSDADSKIYNPLKLPLAWDGKPIPYWLYKLHGLGVEFPCEICGNFVYMGRRAFDKHFNEWRHTHGLRCLGITNTTLFREITKIEEAVRLWEKISGDKKREKTTQEGVTEMEDEEGNVLPYQVWLDLKKQGLL